MPTTGKFETWPIIEAYKQHVDRTLLLENLKLSVEERIGKHMSFARLAEELRRAGQEAANRKEAAQRQQATKTG